MKSKEYAGRRLLTAFLRAPFDFKRKSKMVPLLLKFLKKAHKFLLNLDEIFVIILSLTLVEGKKPRKCCYYSFFRLFYFVKKCVPFSWFWSF